MDKMTEQIDKIADLASCSRLEVETALAIAVTMGKNPEEATEAIQLLEESEQPGLTVAGVRRSLKTIHGLLDRQIAEWEG